MTCDSRMVRPLCVPHNKIVNVGQPLLAVLREFATEA